MPEFIELPVESDFEQDYNRLKQLIYNTYYVRKIAFCVQIILINFIPILCFISISDIITLIIIGILTSVLNACCIFLLYYLHKDMLEFTIESINNLITSYVFTENHGIIRIFGYEFITPYDKDISRNKIINKIFNVGPDDKVNNLVMVDNLLEKLTEINIIPTEHTNIPNLQKIQFQETNDPNSLLDTLFILELLKNYPIKSKNIKFGKIYCSRPIIAVKN